VRCSKHHLSGLGEQDVHHGPFRRRQQHLVHHLRVFVAAAVAADEFHPGAGQRDIEHPGVGGVGQV
jgi:hypothetical protein